MLLALSPQLNLFKPKKVAYFINFQSSILFLVTTVITGVMAETKITPQISWLTTAASEIQTIHTLAVIQGSMAVVCKAESQKLREK